MPARYIELYIQHYIKPRGGGGGGGGGGFKIDIFFSYLTFVTTKYCMHWVSTCIHGVWENNHSGLIRIQIVFEFFNGSAVVKCLTGDRRATGLILTCVTALCSLSKTHLS